MGGDPAQISDISFWVGGEGEGRWGGVVIVVEWDEGDEGGVGSMSWELASPTEDCARVSRRTIYCLKRQSGVRKLQQRLHMRQV